jgi:Flp pilus assembly protein TadD
MGRLINRHLNARTLQQLRPLLTLLLLSDLAACGAIGGGGKPAQLTDSSGMGPSTGVMNVADAAIAGGDPEMALKVSQSVLANDPKNLDAMYHEGQAYYAINRCMDAIAVYKVALTVDPKSSAAQLGIGRCLLKTNAAAAETAFLAALQDEPANAAALNDLGVARDLQGNHAGAVQPYQQALLLNPGNLATEVNIGMSLALSGNGQEALQYLGPLATSPQATPKIREDYAAALVAAGRQDEARQVLTVDLQPAQADQLIAGINTAISMGQAGSVAPAPAGVAVASPDAMPIVEPAPATPVVETALVTPPPPAPVKAAAKPKPRPPVVKTATAAPPPARIVPPVTADPPTPPAAMVASLPAVTPPPVDTPPADTTPPAVAAPATVAPPPKAAAIPAASPPPPPAEKPAPQKSGTWWNLLRAPTAVQQ